MTALAFFSFFFVVLAAVALHRWAANGEEIDASMLRAGDAADLEHWSPSVGWRAR
jgi:hypothetical protein